MNCLWMLAGGCGLIIDLNAKHLDYKYMEISEGFHFRTGSQADDILLHSGKCLELNSELSDSMYPQNTFCSLQFPFLL